MNLQTDRRKLYGGFALIGVVLTACFFVLQKIHSETEFPHVSFSTNAILGFFLAVIVIYFVTILLWKNMCRHFEIARSWLELIVDTGLMAVCKYFPGKIWGMLSRGALKTSTVSFDKKTVIVSVLEQVFLLAVGMLLFAIFYLFSTDQVPRSSLAVLASFVMIVFISTISWLLNRVARLRQHFRHSMQSTVVFVVMQAAGYILLWCLTAVPVLVLVSQQIALTLPETFALAGAFIGAMIAGWLAVFAPGGVGVRESVFVVLAPAFLTWQEGLYWITVHRALVTIFDLLFGLLALCFTIYRVRAQRAIC